MPVVDADRPWGSQNCNACREFCGGHYKVKFVDTKSENGLADCPPPPSTVLKNVFSKLKEYPPSQEIIESAAKKALVTPNIAQLWLEHLHTVMLNRKRGAKKAAESRAKSRTKSSRTVNSGPASTDNETVEDYCGTCTKKYEETNNDDLWIACDMCDKWYCNTCEN
jgi:hypothetical protein